MAPRFARTPLPSSHSTVLAPWSELTVEAVYASTNRVRISEAVQFEAYIGSKICIKGFFCRSGGLWGLECKSVDGVDLGRLGILGAEVLVREERGALMRERVEVEKGKRKKGFCLKLEEIVEGEGEGCDCCYCREEDEEEESEEWEMVGEEEEQEEREGVKWAVEIGIWVMCVGVGYLVSKSSYKGLRRRRIIQFEFF